MQETITRERFEVFMNSHVSTNKMSLAASFAKRDKCLEFLTLGQHPDIDTMVVIHSTYTFSPEHFSICSLDERHDVYKATNFVERHTKERDNV